MIFKAEAEVRWLDHCEVRITAVPLPAPAPVEQPSTEVVR
jgi:hypothetical protein